MALFENGVTVAISGAEPAAAWSFPSQPAVTAVSLFKSTTSRSAAAIPRLTAPTNPWRSGLRRITTPAGSWAAAWARSVSVSKGCGPSSTATRRSRERSVWARRLARQRAKAAAAP